VSDHLKRVVIERLSGLFDDQHPSAHIDVEVTFRDGRFLHVHLTSKTELGRLVMLHLSRGDDSV
jgi:hypothetical protein